MVTFWKNSSSSDIWNFCTLSSIEIIVTISTFQENSDLGNTTKSFDRIRASKKVSGFEPLELFLAFALQYGPRRLCDGVAPDVHALAGCGSDAILMSAALGALAAAVVHLLCSRRQRSLCGPRRQLIIFHCVSTRGGTRASGSTPGRVCCVVRRCSGHLPLSRACLACQRFTRTTRFIHGALSPSQRGGQGSIQSL